MQNMDMDAPSLDSLPPHVTQQVKDLIARGNKIEAIKIFRSATGLGLKESKDVIDAISAGNAQAANQLMMGMAASAPQTPAAAGDTLAQVRQLMRADEKIQAIRVLREASGLGLKDAKDAVEALAAGNDQPVQSALAQRRVAPSTVASKKPKFLSGVAVPRRGASSLR